MAFKKAFKYVVQASQGHYLIIMNKKKKMGSKRRNTRES
jgi:hypothetical protein